MGAQHGATPIRPSDHVGSETYLATLDRRAAACEFPHPDPEAVPALTTARYVARAAADAGDDEFATAVRERRDPVVEAVAAFDEAVADLRAAEGSPDPTRLAPRTRTFLDSPGPPHDLAEVAEARGRETVAVEAATTTHDRERRRVRAVAVGARTVTEEALDEAGVEGWPPGAAPPRVGTVIQALGSADGDPETADDGAAEGETYDTRAAYVDTVAFNLGLAAEAWLAERGDIPRAP